MEYLTSDHVIFWSLVHLEYKNEVNNEKQLYQLLFTMESLYLEVIKLDQHIQLKQLLASKFKHQDYIIEDYNFENKEITITNKGKEVIIVFKSESEITKNYIKLMILTQGFYMSQLLYEANSVPLNYLYILICKLLNNNFSVVLGEEYFIPHPSNNEMKLMQIFSNYLMRFDSFKLDINLFNYEKEFSDYFLSSKSKYEKASYSFIDINVSEAGLTDSAFTNFILPFMKQCPQLNKLKAAKNFLTNFSLESLIEYFTWTRGKRSTKVTNNPNKSLPPPPIEILDFSMNLIESTDLNNQFLRLLELFRQLKEVNLKSNRIDELFLQKLDSNLINNIIHEELVLDVRDNKFDYKTIANKFFLRSTESLSSHPDLFKESNKHFDQLSYDANKFKVLINQYDTSYFKSSNKRLMGEKEVLISKTLINNRNRGGIKNEMLLYQKYFQYFFLIDYYFDPILNSFSTKRHKQILQKNSYLSEANQEETYNQLQSAIKEEEEEKLKRSTKSIMKQENEQTNFYQIPYHEALLMNNDYNYHTKTCGLAVSSIAKNILLGLDEYLNSEVVDFNPNAYIDHLYLFYVFLLKTGSNQMIPYTSLHKFINRVKIESFLAVKEKDFSSLQKLSRIVTGLQLSIMTKVNKTFERVRLKANEINNGIIKLINFSSEETNDIFYDKRQQKINNLNEINNYLDLFIKEAETINFMSDEVFLAKYIKYLRNNNIRNQLWQYYEELLRREGLLNFTKCVSEFDPVFDKFKTITDPSKLFKTTDEIKYKQLAFHPTLLDYLVLSETKKQILDNDLDIMKREIQKKRDSFIQYGAMNIYSRIRFLFTKAGSNPDYKLHKNNSFLKVTRVLFRYFNSLDFPKKVFTAHEMKWLKPQKINESLVDIAHQAIDLYLPQENQHEDMNISQKNELKRKVLSYSPDNNSIPIVNISLYQKDASFDPNVIIEASKKLYESIKNVFKSSPEMDNLSSFYLLVKEHNKCFLDLKQTYKSNKLDYWKIINQEAFYQLFRFCNRDDFRFSNQNTQTKFSFAFLYISCFYLELPINSVGHIKSFAFYLNSRKYFSNYCKGIIYALNNPVRYNWAISCFELKHRIDGTPIKISVKFYDDYAEEYEIDERTTGMSLFEKILSESKVLKDSKERQLYWLYLINNQQPNNYTYINGDSYIVEIISNEEEEALKDLLGKLTEVKSYKTQKSITNRIRGNRGSILTSAIMKESTYYDPSRVFDRVSFAIRRRIFSPLLNEGNLINCNKFEKELLFKQIKTVYLHDKRIDLTWFDIGNILGSILLIDLKLSFEKNIRASRVGEKFDLDKNIPFAFSKVHYTSELFDKQTIEEIINEKQLMITSHEGVIKKFFMNIKQRPMIFSNIFHVDLKSSSEPFPYKFLISISIEKVEFLDKTKYKTIFEFAYNEIVKCVYAGEELLSLTLVMQLDEEDQERVIQIKLRSPEAQFIMEDILSYGQFYLARNTNSLLTDYHINEDEKKERDMKNYKMIYQRNMPFHIIRGDAKTDIIENELKQMRDLKKSNSTYQTYKQNKDKAKKEKEDKVKEEELKKLQENKMIEDKKEQVMMPKSKLSKDILSSHFGKFNPLTGAKHSSDEDDDDDEDEDEDDSDDEKKVVVVKKFNPSTLSKGSIIEANVPKEIENKVDSENEKDIRPNVIKNESQIIKEVPEENQIEVNSVENMKLQENIQKKENAQFALSQALNMIDFSDDEDEEQKEEDNNDDYY